MKPSVLFLARLLILSGYLFVAPLFAAGQDPIVLQVGDESVTLSQFNHQFEMAMVMAALREGVPNKSGILIRDLKERYLNVRARELLLRQHAGSGIAVSAEEVDEVLQGLAREAAEVYEGEQASLVAQMESLREYVKEELLLARIRQSLVSQANPPPVSHERTVDYIENWLEQQATKTAVRMWPERLD